MGGSQSSDLLVSTGKVGGVSSTASTLRHQHEDQSKVQRRPESSSAESEAESGYSGLSFRSSRSKDDIIDFRSRRLSALRSPAGPDSPFTVYSYPSLGTNRSTDTNLDFNFRHPIPSESYRRAYEELLQHEQEVIRQQEVQLRHQEVQLRHQEVQLHYQEALLHHQEALLRQPDFQSQGERKAKWEAQEAKREALEAKREALEAKREALEAKREALEAKREALEAKRQLKLKRLEDQQHLKSGKNNSHESKRIPAGLTSTLARRRRCPPAPRLINITDDFSTQPARLQTLTGLISSEVESLNLSDVESSDSSED